MFLQSERIDIFFRNKKQHLVSALAQHFGDGQAREEMPARSSACNDRVHSEFISSVIPSCEDSEGPLIDICAREKIFCWQ